MKLRAAWVLWLIAAVIIGCCAGAVTGAFPEVAGWLAVALGLATVGAALLTHDHEDGGPHARTRR